TDRACVEALAAVPSLRDWPLVVLVDDAARAAKSAVNFLWTTAVGIIPGAIVFTWIGVGLGSVFDRGETPDLSLLWEPHVIGPIIGLCVLAALPILLKKRKPRAGNAPAAATTQESEQ
ncbi:MAG: hypothetical protein ACPGSW_07295, partial [Phaeobacter italicus]